MDVPREQGKLSHIHLAYNKGHTGSSRLQTSEVTILSQSLLSYLLENTGTPLDNVFFLSWMSWQSSISSLTERLR